MTSPLSPDDVAQRSFATSFRGFEPGEVRAFLARLAEQLREAEARTADLTERLAAAEERAAHPQLDIDTLTTALGDETARILKSAQDAAHDIRSKAEENISQLLREAYEEASRLRAEAELVLAKETEAAEAVAAEIRAAADSEAATALGRARQEAERLLGEVEARARLMVDEAEAARAKVLGDLARRRRVAHAQVEQLRAGRERLLEAYRVVRTTLDEVTEELVKAESEARQAAEDTGRRLASEPDAPAPEEDVLAEFDAPPVVERAPEPPPAEEPPLPEEAPAEPEPEPEPEAEPAEAVVADVVELPPTRRLAGNPVAPAPAEAETSEWRNSSLRIIRRPKVEEPEPEPEAEPEVEAEPPAAEEPPLPEEEPAAVAAEVAEPEPDVDERSAEPATAASAVDELFARIRAEAPVEPELEADPAPEPELVVAGSEAEAGPEPDSESEPAPSSDDEARLQQRDAALEDVDQRLSRRLKRALQDDQNDVLDRLRVHRGRVHADALLPAAEAHPTRFRDVAAALLGEAAAAGARFVDGDPVDTKLDDLIAGLADDVVGSLRRRLERSLEEGSDEEHALVVERIGAAYREAKGRRVEQLASDYAVAAFSRGTLGAVPERTPLRWIVDDGGEPCPDCDDNALAGPTPCGDAYPTGQSHPPAHAGCRCLVVPAQT